MERIEADILIPGRGETIHDGCVVLDGPTIAYAGPTLGAPVTPGAGIYRVPAVLPGLWDCHAHFMGMFSPDLAELATNAPALTAMRVARDAAVALCAGYTSVREVGGLGVWVSRAVAEGTVKGPNVFGVGAVLSPTGGHADLHMYPVEWVNDLADRMGMLGQCDGARVPARSPAPAARGSPADQGLRFRRRHEPGGRSDPPTGGMGHATTLESSPERLEGPTLAP